MVAERARLHRLFQNALHYSLRPGVPVCSALSKSMIAKRLVTVAEVWAMAYKDFDHAYHATWFLRSNSTMSYIEEEINMQLVSLTYLLSLFTSAE